ncbi:immunity 22 family protein [Snodgrassella sp.]|uniref:immunity 22 family protein n=1 Tax=Snodgrassella sp. TaxID=2815304 RepID=UPI00258EC68D|nr:immunity 22 family protein [Snodgrassella sp.]MCO6519409.1 immunity 22 family protein [Snodgrassella sp.]
MNKIDLNKVTIQLWIGNNFLSDEEYQHYFHQIFEIPASFFDNKPSCLFCADLGEPCYIEKSMVIPDRFSSPQDINLIIDKIEVNEGEKKNIYERCIKLGITTANTVFWYINNDLSLNLDVQKPYKENYNGLKYIGEFNADTKYPFNAFDPTSDSHLWIGTNHMPVDEFNQYFELDFTEEFGSPEYKICGFCKDTGNEWYDEDFIGYPEPLKEEVDIATLVDQLITSDLDCKNQIVQACNKLGITKANAVIWYTAESEYDSEFKLQKPYKDSYNGLKYIGVFKF